MSRTERVAELLAEGLSRAEIARRLGVSKPTVTYHCRKLGLEADARFTRRYTWLEGQAYYDAGHTMRECQARFGFSSACWYEARKRGDLVTREAAMPVEELLAAPRNRAHLKLRLIRAGLKENRCEQCAITEWRGRPLSMCLHHVNGDKHDNRLENLQFLCPNCHAQTDNFAGRNKSRRAA